ncbi:MAG TPA: glycine--tRNA ligase subunit beta [Candidatus Mcinerneyibacteriales bacterium]|nr:glycine--tRNA ligase subunit beta [Candidatus Mcinerneyibacteriales bacterium]HPE20667.1 glycine--tRNA ligase subunit beta [Candidatus Mcinerneyibacteriales bacterium]HPJ70078.1 glycine--tRNA ligase subunit beta [Candidatus Mcinerneyibacteriales bacterium]HPQ89236.1 glycine--tRNA ligase subunit beta [Candidatus Mcinerneyibacteriales bacterium]
MRDLLLEIGVEELPADYIPGAIASLEAQFRRLFEENRITVGSSEALATPRRLVFFCQGVAEKEEDRTEKVMGPPRNICIKEGKVTMAYEKFLEKNNLTESDIFWEETEKGAYLAAHRFVPGRMTRQIITEAWPGILGAVEFPKKMRWDDSGLLFARPVRWLLAFWGEETLPLKAGGVTAGQETFLLRNSPKKRARVSSPATYLEVVEKSGLILSRERRRKVILEGLQAVLEKNGASSFHSESLVEEVVDLVEAPFVLTGEIAKHYLALPPEVISAAMSQHQRYFSFYREGKVLPLFAFVANGSFVHPGKVIRGNERVLKARLDDAMFYWKEDTSRGVERLFDLLDTVTWMEGLGSLSEKAARLESLTAFLFDGDETARTGARMSKIDIVSEMIKDGKEFTKLQGSIAKYYLLEDGREEEVACIAEEHYWPRVWGDPLPRPRAAAVGLADRADNIIGAFLKGFIPTGTKDPYALRRQANSMIALILGYEKGEVHLDKGFDLESVQELFIKTARLYGAEVLPPKEEPELLRQVNDFFEDRFRAQLRALGIPYDIVDAVCDTPEKNLKVKYRKALAFKALSGRDEFRDVAATFRRVNNIVKKAREELRVEDFGLPRDDLFVEKETKAMSREWVNVKEEIQRAGDDYDRIFNAILNFKTFVDPFFDTVLVMDKDASLRNNRLALLQDISALFGGIVNFDHIVVT